MYKPSEYESCDAIDLAHLVLSGHVTPLELLETAIERIEKLNPMLNAVVNPLYDQARQEIAQGLPEGPLQGVPFLLKDLGLFMKGIATTFGSRFFADFTPTQDSTLTRRYRQAGLVICGKTNVPEFGLTVTTEPQLFGPCRNPWDVQRTPGGSSGGTAAAVASGMVPAAHGSDGGGSIRIPAACCGLFGLKPTRARVPSGPVIGEGWAGMTADHVITRSVRDSAILLDIAAGPAPGDPYCAPPPPESFLDHVGRDPGRLNIAVSITPPTGAEVDPHCIAAVEAAAKLCESLGHRTQWATPAIDNRRFRKAVGTLISANVCATLDARARALGREATQQDVERVTWQTAKAGQKASAADYVRAVNTIHYVGRQVSEFFHTYDMLLTPVLVCPPVRLGFLDMMAGDISEFIDRMNRFFGFTNLFNATGQPAMSVPLFWAPEGLPIGVQFAGRFGDEAGLFRLAGQLESAQPWKDRRPLIGH
jgi:amidase